MSEMTARHIHERFSNSAPDRLRPRPHGRIQQRGRSRSIHWQISNIFVTNFVRFAIKETRSKRSAELT